MNIVINIDDHKYKEIKEDAEVYRNKGMVVPYLYKVIESGTPLPKGYGRLGDLDKIWSELKELEEYYQTEFLKESNVIHKSAMNGRLYGFTNSKFIVQDAPTIISADKESNDADSN